MEYSGIATVHSIMVAGVSRNYATFLFCGADMEIDVMAIEDNCRNKYNTNFKIHRHVIDRI